MLTVGERAKSNAERCTFRECRRHHEAVGPVVRAAWGGGCWQGTAARPGGSGGWSWWHAVAAAGGAGRTTGSLFGEDSQGGREERPWGGFHRRVGGCGYREEGPRGGVAAARRRTAVSNKRASGRGGPRKIRRQSRASGSPSRCRPNGLWLRWACREAVSIPSGPRLSGETADTNRPRAAFLFECGRGL